MQKEEIKEVMEALLTLTRKEAKPGLLDPVVIDRVSRRIDQRYWDRPHKETVDPDYSLAWVRGWEYVYQDGSTLIERMRKERGWTRQDVHHLAGGEWDLHPGVQAEVEGDYSLAMVTEIDQLISYAIIFGCRPGELLDRIFEEAGEKLLDEDEQDAAATS